MYMNPNNGPTTRSARRSPRVAGERSLQGRIVGLDASGGLLELEDERAGRRWSVDLSRARFSGVSDCSGDGLVGIHDLFPGDRLRIRARSGEEPISARRVEMLSRPGPVGGLRQLWPV